MISSSYQTAVFHDLPARVQGLNVPISAQENRAPAAKNESSAHSSGNNAPPAPTANPARTVQPTSAADSGTLFQAQEEGQKAEKKKSEPPSGKPSVLNAADLSEGEQRQLDELKRRDAEVRRHEQTHKAIAGPYAGPAQYEYVTGPDGQQYAVSGEVSISTSPAGTAEASISKLETVIRAALAPSSPSAQDRAAAQAARQQIQALRAEAQAEKLEEGREQGSEASSESEGNDKSTSAFGPATQAYNQVQEAVSNLISQSQAASAQILFGSGTRIDLNA